MDAAFVLYKVFVPAGNVAFVVAVLVSVVANAPEVIRLPPSVMVLL